MKKNRIFCLFTLFIISFSKLSFSEPFVVLEYRGNSNRGSLNSDNLFLRDLNYSANHVVLKNETLKTGLIKEKDYNRIVDPKKMIYPI